MNVEDTIDGASTPAPKKRKTYKQAWAQYNDAQTHEQGRVELLLKALCAGIAQPPRKPGPGRNPIPLRDAIFAAVMNAQDTDTTPRRAISCHAWQAPVVIVRQRR